MSRSSTSQAAVHRAGREDAANRRQPEDRRGAILHTAQRLFAARGFHGVSIRDIAQEAKVPLALVGYHFGPKLALYHAIFREHANYIQTRLHNLALAQLHAPPGQLLVEIVKAFVLPVLELAQSPDGRSFLRLLARGMSEQLEEDTPIIEELFDPLALAFIEALSRARPQAKRQTVAWCYQFALGALIHHVTDERILRLCPPIKSSRGVRASDLLVRFIAHGIEGACATPEPLGP